MVGSGDRPEFHQGARPREPVGVPTGLGGEDVELGGDHDRGRDPVQIRDIARGGRRHQPVGSLSGIRNVAGVEDLAHPRPQLRPADHRPLRPRRHGEIQHRIVQHLQRQGGAATFQRHSRHRRCQRSTCALATDGEPAAVPPVLRAMRGEPARDLVGMVRRIREPMLRSEHILGVDHHRSRCGREQAAGGIVHRSQIEHVPAAVQVEMHRGHAGVRLGPIHRGGGEAERCRDLQALRPPRILRQAHTCTLGRPGRAEPDAQLHEAGDAGGHRTSGEDRHEADSSERAHSRLCGHGRAAHS